MTAESDAGPGHICLDGPATPGPHHCACGGWFDTRVRTVTTIAPIVSDWTEAE